LFAAGLLTLPYMVYCLHDQNIFAVDQIVGNITKKPRDLLWEKVGVSETNPILIWARRIVTFILVCLAWMIFRANSMKDLGKLYSLLFTGWGGVSISASLSALGMPIITLVTIVFSIYVMNQLDKQVILRDKELRLNESLTVGRSHAFITVCWCIAAAWMILLASNTASSFIYFQF